MKKHVKRHSEKAGLPPGALIHVGEGQAGSAVMTVFDFDHEHLEERRIEELASLSVYKDTATVTWINLDGIHDIDAVARLGELYGLHPLTCEDILSSHQRPKIEEFGDYLYVVLRMLRCNGEDGAVLSEQVSLVLGKNFVLSFQEMPGDVFDPLRDRLRTDSGRARRHGADYLFYRLIDLIVDGYFVVLERFGEHIETLEEELMDDPGPETSRVIMELKSELLDLRKATWPLREVVSQMERSESELITDSTTVFLRDVYDHAIRVAETVDNYREMVAGLRDMYMTVISNKMNEVMKVLTIIATIFIPITFLAGVYGMNFEAMPELKLPWAYPALLAVMATVVVGMLVYFRRRRWI